MKLKFEENLLNLYDGSKIIGYIKFSIKDEILTVISTVVSADYQGQGLARKMMDEIMVYAKNNNLEVDSICSYGIKYLEKLNS